MKFVSRLSLFLAVFALLWGPGLGTAHAQPNDKYSQIFAAADNLKEKQPEKAYNAYLQIKNDHSKEPDLAAEALLRAGQVAADDRYGATEVARQQGRIKAHDAYKQLLQQYPETHAAQIAQPAQKALEGRIDKYNSQYLSYRLIDSLVAMTGRIPWFSYWFALVLIAVIVKALTLPLTLKMYKSQREMQKLQPKLKELQERYKNQRNSPELTQKTMELYKEHGVNPLASCFPLLIQMPFLIWVYNTIRLYEYHFSNGYFLWIGSPMVRQFPGTIAANLAQFDFLLLVLYAASNYLTMKLTPSPDPQQAAQQRQMSVMMTIMMFWMFMIYRWSAAFILYWLALNLVTAWQQYTYIYKPARARLSNGDIVIPPGPPSASEGNGSSGGDGKAPKDPANGNGSGRVPRQVTPVPGGNTMRARPRRKRR